jgi:peptidoglycan/xylan/chitin deacetylase (PgdA/CDA1 family)
MGEWFSDCVKRSAGTAGVLLNRLLGSRVGNRPGMLVYHRVSPRFPGLPEPTINVTPRRFREQLAGLLRLGFRFSPLREVLEAQRRGFPVAPRTVIVTFDDGHGSVYTRAWPVLRELGVPATVFLNTAYLDQEGAFPFDAWGRAHQGSLPAEAYRPLMVEQCREMARTGLMELGAHTHTHRDLRGQPGEFERDLSLNVETLRTLFGLEQPTFAFPFGRRHLGYVSDELIAAARRTGVRCALTTEAAPIDLADDPFEWGRFNAYDWDTAAMLAGKLTGWYGWAPRLQERLAGCWRRRKAVASR